MLTPRQKKQLKALAHHLDPVVRIGQHGLTPGVTAETGRALESHELIKVKVDAEGDERKQLASGLAAETGAEVVNLIGKVAILYRRRAENPTIKLQE